MHGERTYVITGATSGMGLLLARKLAQSAGTRLLVGARTPALARALQRVVPASRLTLLELDLATWRPWRNSAIGLPRCLDEQRPWTPSFATPVYK